MVAVILSWSFDNSIRIWDIRGNEIVRFEHDDWLIGASWNSDETTILSWSADGTARIWSVEGYEITQLPHGRLDENGTAC